MGLNIILLQRSKGLLCYMTLFPQSIKCPSLLLHFISYTTQAIIPLISFPLSLSAMENSLLRSSRMKNLWESGNFKVEKAYPGGYPWPPRHYSCSFCGREFSSAQALGGHMNVHRRDRARLRDNSPPSSWVNLNLQNPNPNFSSPSSNIYTNQYSLLTLSLSSFSSPQASRNEEELVAGMKARGESLRDFPRVNISGLEGFSHGDGSVEVSKVREVVKLDLELGLLREEEEELDLELRLGN